MSGFTKAGFDGVEFFAVAIKTIRVDQRHVGVLYRTENGDLRFLHLFDEDDLQCGEPGPKLSWAEVGLDDTNRELLAELADAIASKHAGESIGFGIGFRGEGESPFSEDGEWNRARSMTCATFVLALFLAHGFQLVDLEKWPDRVVDRDYARSLIREMVSPIDAELLETQLQDYRRVRPEEAAVAARGFEDNLPYSFDLVGPASERLLDSLGE